jgi:hypothetical protein
MEKKLRAKLEEELMEYREAAEREKRGIRNWDNNASMESLEEIRRKFSEAEEKVCFCTCI